MRRSPRRALLLLAVAALASACAKQPPPGVNVKSVSTELVFGIPPSEKPVPPSNTSLQPEEPLGVISVGPVVTPRPVVKATPIPDCRDAGLTDFPEVAASTTAQGRPKVGQYKWKVAGKQNVTTLGTVPLPGLTKRSVLSVAESGAVWQYTVEERELTFGSTTMVKTTYQVQNESSGGLGAGVYLVRIERTAGGTKRTFSPAPAVLLLPIPVRLGLSVDAVGVDPTTLEALHNTGLVSKRQRVDACGKVLDSWLVDGDQEFVSGGGNSYKRDYNYGIATQYGGMLVFEHVESPCAAKDSGGKCTPAGDLIFDANIGQLDPDPLPRETPKP